MVFSLLDVLSRWLKDAAAERGGGEGAEDPGSPLSRVRAFTASLPVELLARAASRWGL